MIPVHILDLDKPEEDVHTIKISLVDSAGKKIEGSDIVEGSLKVDPWQSDRCLNPRKLRYEGGNALFEAALVDGFVTAGNVREVVKKSYFVEISAKPKDPSKGGKDGLIKKQCEVSLKAASIRGEWWPTLDGKRANPTSQDIDSSPMELEPDGKSGIELQLWLERHSKDDGAELKREDYMFTHWLDPNGPLELKHVDIIPRPSTVDAKSTQSKTFWKSVMELPVDAPPKLSELPYHGSMRVTAYPPSSVTGRFDAKPFVTANRSKEALKLLSLTLIAPRFRIHSLNLDCPHYGKDPLIVDSNSENHQQVEAELRRYNRHSQATTEDEKFETAKPPEKLEVTISKDDFGVIDEIPAEVVTEKGFPIRLKRVLIGDPAWVAGESPDSKALVGELTLDRKADEKIRPEEEKVKLPVYGKPFAATLELEIWSNEEKPRRVWPGQEQTETREVKGEVVEVKCPKLGAFDGELRWRISGGPDRLFASDSPFHVPPPDPASQGLQGPSQSSWQMTSLSGGTGGASATLHLLRDGTPFSTDELTLPAEPPAIDQFEIRVRKFGWQESTITVSDKTTPAIAKAIKEGKGVTLEIGVSGEFKSSSGRADLSSYSDDEREIVYASAECRGVTGVLASKGSYEEEFKAGAGPANSRYCLERDGSGKLTLDIDGGGSRFEVPSSLYAGDAETKKTLDALEKVEGAIFGGARAPSQGKGLIARVPGSDQGLSAAFEKYHKGLFKEYCKEEEARLEETEEKRHLGAGALFYQFALTSYCASMVDDAAYLRKTAVERWLNVLFGLFIDGLFFMLSFLSTLKSVKLLRGKFGTLAKKLGGKLKSLRKIAGKAARESTKFKGLLDDAARMVKGLKDKLDDLVGALKKLKDEASKLKGVLSKAEKELASLDEAARLARDQARELAEKGLKEEADEAAKALRKLQGQIADKKRVIADNKKLISEANERINKQGKGVDRQRKKWKEGDRKRSQAETKWQRAEDGANDAQKRVTEMEGDIAKCEDAAKNKLGVVSREAHETAEKHGRVVSRKLKDQLKAEAEKPWYSRVLRFLTKHITVFKWYNPLTWFGAPITWVMEKVGEFAGEIMTAVYRKLGITLKLPQALLENFTGDVISDGIVKGGLTQPLGAPSPGAVAAAIDPGLLKGLGIATRVFQGKYDRKSTKAQIKARAEANRNKLEAAMRRQFLDGLIWSAERATDPDADVQFSDYGHDSSAFDARWKNCRTYHVELANTLDLELRSQKGTEGFFASAAHSVDTKNQTYLDLINTIDWVCFLVAWGSRAAAIVIGLTGVGLGVAAFLFMLASAVDIAKGAGFAYYDLFYDLVRKEKYGKLLVASPLFIHATLFSKDGSAARVPDKGWFKTIEKGDDWRTILNNAYSIITG